MVRYAKTFLLPPTSFTQTLTHISARGEVLFSKRYQCRYHSTGTYRSVGSYSERREIGGKTSSICYARHPIEDNRSLSIGGQGSRPTSLCTANEESPRTGFCPAAADKWVRNLQWILSRLWISTDIATVLSKTLIAAGNIKQAMTRCTRRGSWV